MAIGMAAISVSLTLTLNSSLAQQRRATDGQVEIRVVARESHSPVESRIEFSSSGAPGSWQAIGATSGGVLRINNPCPNGGMLRASPTDRAYHQSVPYNCGRNPVVIPLRRLGSSALALITTNCGEVEAAFVSPANQLGGTEPRILAANRYAFGYPQAKLGSIRIALTETQISAEGAKIDQSTNPTDEAEPIWIEASKSFSIRAAPSRNSQSVYAIEIGTPLIPTGNVAGNWWQVTDIYGSHLGWVELGNFVVTPDKHGYPDPCKIPGPAPVGIAPPPPQTVTETHR